MSSFNLYCGNCPKNVSKDAKYCVRSGKNGPVIGLLYYTDDGERWRMTTQAHPKLVEMVNAVKMTHGSAANGPFYINEYKQVIVPVGESAQYYLAGKYEEALRFDFEGQTISGEPVDPKGQRMRPGDRWTGPHAGIPYVLAAAGNDVYYWQSPRPDVEKKVKLSAARGKTAAEQIGRLLSAFKGNGGGRFYVNEFGAVFSPVNGEDGWNHVYFGQIDLGSWFPEPTQAPN
jgi:hypothetical protein